MTNTEVVAQDLNLDDETDNMKVSLSLRKISVMISFTLNNKPYFFLNDQRKLDK